MPSLKDLKDRTKSVKSTRKITQAMKLIATSRYNKFNCQITAASRYVSDLQFVLQKIRTADHQMFEESIKNWVNTSSKNGKALLIIFGSDKGLCGSFNTNITKVLQKQILGYEQRKTKYKIVCYGNKIAQHVEKYYGNDILLAQESNNKKIFTDLHSVSSELACELLKHVTIKDYSTCDFIYSSHVSAVSTSATVQRVLPPNDSLDKSSNDWYDFDNSLETTCDQTMRGLFLAHFYRVYLNSIVSEYSSRMMAMEHATNNAKNLLAELKMDYNRKRQAYITKELIEIISGAEAIKV